MAATLSQLRTRAKRLADMENSSFLAAAEWDDLLNEGGAQLHDIIVGKYEDYLVSSASISLVAGTAAYSLPNDYYKTRGVDFGTGSSAITLRAFEFTERNRRNYDSVAPNGDASYQYQIVGSNIRFIPTPTASGTATHWYIPMYTVLASDGSTIPTSYSPGWEAYMVTYAAMRARIKEQTDVNDLRTDLESHRRQVEAAAGNRDAGGPRRVVDVRHRGDGWW